MARKRGGGEKKRYGESLENRSEKKLIIGKRQRRRERMRRMIKKTKEKKEEKRKTWRKIRKQKKTQV